MEATALGNVLVQALSAGELASVADLRAVVRASFEPEQFAPGGRDLWAADRFGRLLDRRPIPGG